MKIRWEREGPVVHVLVVVVGRDALGLPIIPPAVDTIFLGAGLSVKGRKRRRRREVGEGIFTVGTVCLFMYVCLCMCVYVCVCVCARARDMCAQNKNCEITEKKYYAMGGAQNKIVNY